MFLYVNFPLLGTPKKKTRTSKERVPQPKNTVAMLNELRHGLVYKLESQSGPVHAPLFTISVEVSYNEKEFCFCFKRNFIYKSLYVRSYFEQDILVCNFICRRNNGILL